MPIGLPIDHVLVPNDFSVKSIEPGPKAVSDHYSVFANIAVPRSDLQKETLAVRKQYYSNIKILNSDTIYSPKCAII